MSFKEKNKNQSIRRSSRLFSSQYTTPRHIKQRSISLPAKSKQPKTFKKQKSSSKQHKPIKSSSKTSKSNKKKSKSTRKRFSRKKRRTKTIGQGDGTKENPYKADRNVAHYETRKQNQFDEYNDETLIENRKLKKENKKAKETIDKQNKRIEDQDNVNQSMQSVLEQQELVTNQFAVALSKCLHLYQQLKKKYDVSEMEVRKLAMEYGDYLASKDNNDMVHVEVAYESNEEKDTKDVYYNFGPRKNAIRKWVGYKVKVIVLVLRLAKKVNSHNMPSVIVIILETFSPGFTKDIRIPCPNTIRYWQKHFSQDLSDMALIHKLQNKEYEYQTLTNQQDAGTVKGNTFTVACTTFKNYNDVNTNMLENETNLPIDIQNEPNDIFLRYKKKKIPIKVESNSIKKIQSHVDIIK
eukprot:448074_1